MKGLHENVDEHENLTQERAGEITVGYIRANVVRYTYMKLASRTRDTFGK
jgi:hypothetical protein